MDFLHNSGRAVVVRPFFYPARQFPDFFDVTLPERIAKHFNGLMAFWRSDLIFPSQRHIPIS
jgi:hypothetical protein